MEKNWLIPHTLRVMFTLNKRSGGEVRVIGNPWCFFQRMRVMCGGQVIEDITNYNRVHEMISKLQSTDEKESDNIEGFGVDYKEHINSVEGHENCVTGQKTN